MRHLNLVGRDRIRGYYLFFMITNPGATAPTTLYDITLLDSDGIDMAGGVLANRSATVSEEAIPLLASGVSGDRIVNGALDVTITAAGNAKIGELKLWFRK